MRKTFFNFKSVYFSECLILFVARNPKVSLLYLLNLLSLLSLLNLLSEWSPLYLEFRIFIHSFMNSSFLSFSLFSSFLPFTHPSFHSSLLSLILHFILILPLFIIWRIFWCIENLIKIKNLMFDVSHPLRADYLLI